ncbi:hypothetical protein ACQPX6_18985 [Actinomycetospora sp. CA-101289]|uniref:hypothetical protein n=1 Tax=Actinomycetospora sp. CA-101289 TaxID=3239893 RepID=UPI003D99B762
MTAAVADDRPAAPPLAEAAPGSAATSPAPPSAGDRLRAVAVAMVDRLAAAATAKVEEVSDRLGDMAADAAKGALGGAGAGKGVFANAALQGGLAKLQGKNPVWAAIKGGVSAMGPGTKVLVGLLLILLAVLSPVALIVLALVLLVAAIAGAFSG